MDRRFLMVLGVSLLFALVVSSIFYQMAGRAGSSRQAEPTDMKDVVVAAKPLPIGVTIKTGDVKIQKTSSAAFPKGAFTKLEEVIDRPVVSGILADEPVLDARLAARGSGLGLAPIIPVGLRAVSVRVSDVSGVTGFVLPGMRVDVLVTGRPPTADGSMTATCLQNILVLSAGTTITPDARGQAINAQTVTLLVSPEQAELLTLAGNEGKIQLVLRNGSDQTIEKTPGKEIYELYGRGGRRHSAADEGAPRPRQPRSRPAVVAVAAPPPPPPPAPVAPPEVVIIRGNQKSVEVVGAARNN